MANPATVDALSQTTEDVSSQPIMKLQINNYQVKSDVTVYPEEL